MRNREMTTDEAVTAFTALLQRALGIEPDTQPRLVPETPQEAEARRLRCAETLLQSVCGGLARCRDPRCRRSSCCRHLADAAAAQQRTSSGYAGRRTPGAVAARHAIWLWMTQGPGESV